MNTLHSSAHLVIMKFTITCTLPHVRHFFLVIALAHPIGIDPMKIHYSQILDLGIIAVKFHFNQTNSALL